MAAGKNQQGVPERYCLGCGYPLFGLPEPRCPECGRAFDPLDPSTFALSPKQPWITSLWRTRIAKTGVVFLALLLLLAFVEGGLDRGRRSETCPQCGARSQVKHLVFYGLGGDYGRVTSEGPVSQFIQRQNGSACPHPWAAIKRGGGGLILRLLGTINRRSRDRDVHVSRLENECSRLAEFLQTKADADPQFVHDLKVSLQGDDQEASDAFLDALFLEACAWAQSRDD